MDIGKHKDDFTFYEGYEDEGEVVITLSDVSYHIWDGFFEDIFGNPISTKDGWYGFTKDYNEFNNAFSGDCVECAILPEEYLGDLALYEKQEFSYPETKEVFALLGTVLRKAEEMKTEVFVRVN